MKKVILISGVGKGFGRELVKSLSKEYDVLGVSRTEEDLDSLREELQNIGLSATLVTADIADFDQAKKLIIASLNELDAPLYGLINNAGVRHRKKFLDLSVTDFMNVSGVNLFGSINLALLAMPRMIQNGQGRIINISSIISKSALPELSAYAVSKGGLDALTRSLAVEYGQNNITVNSILPGFCKTSYYPKFSKNSELLNMTLQKTPMNRWGEDNELVGLCRFLLSSEAAYITGTSIPVDGGWLA